MIKILMSLISVGFLFLSSVSSAEDVVYDANTGNLTIPNVLIGSDYYQVQMQQESATSFKLQSYAKADSKATIESVDVLILESFPVQIHVVAKGYLNNGCGKISTINTEKSASAFNITITAIYEDAICTQALVPFEQNIPLDVVNLKAGTYSVSVNGVSGSFTLDVDNSIQQ